jgi:hypothetical protein
MTFADLTAGDSVFVDILTAAVFQARLETERVDFEGGPGNACLFGIPK